MESLEWTELMPIVFVVVGTLAKLMSQTDSATSGGWSPPSMQVIPVVVFVLTLAALGGVFHGYGLLTRWRLGCLVALDAGIVT
jgi:hypothetical protein